MTGVVESGAGHLKVVLLLGKVGQLPVDGLVPGWLLSWGQDGTDLGWRETDSA